VSLHEAVVGDWREATSILMGAVSLVLLIACANVANLLLSHTASRVRELATRVALGAGRGRLVRQLASENLVLWMAGAVLGLGVAHWGLAALLATAPVALPPGIEPRISLAVLAYTLGVTALTGLCFGLLPALRFSRPDVLGSLKDGGRGSSESATRTRLRGALVVSQVALTLLLLAGAGLLLRSLEKLTRVPLGYDASQLLTMEYRMPANRYADGASQWQFHKAVAERVRALPGVAAASVVRALPFSGNRSSVTFEVPDQAPAGPAEQRALLNTADEAWFSAMKIPLLRGRVFEERDGAEAPRVVVVNRALAERAWPGADPIGRPLRLMTEPPVTATVVGIVGDVKHDSLEDVDQLQVYAAQPQNPHIFGTLVVRTEGEPMALTTSVRAALWSVDRDQPVWKIRTLESLVEGSLGYRRFLLQLLGFYALLALALAALGLYGVVSYGVTSRTHEIGVRVAVGAGRGQIVALVLERGLGLAAVGVGIGLAAALSLGRVMSGLVFGIGGSDPLTLAGVSALLLGVAGFASYLPARRATRIDPVRALRCD
jgi:putative ABC transport system permease protein